MGPNIFEFCDKKLLSVKKNKWPSLTVECHDLEMSTYGACTSLNESKEDYDYIAF